MEGAEEGDCGWEKKEEQKRGEGKEEGDHFGNFGTLISRGFCCIWAEGKGWTDRLV